MRYVTFRLHPGDGELHPFGTIVRDNPEIKRRAIHHFNALADEHAMILVEFEGPVDEIRRVVDEEADVISSKVSATEAGVFVYAHFHPKDWTKQLYTASLTSEIFVDMPMYYTDRGALEITTIGEFEEIQNSRVELPDGVGLELISTGEYTPTSDEVYEQLTSKQQETLRAAIEIGYYEEPRRVTYQDVAEELGVAAGTVGEHLRKVESTVLTNVLPAHCTRAPVP